MDDIYERVKCWADKFLETEVDFGLQEPHSEFHEEMSQMLSWANRRVAPVLLVMIAIDLLIIFASPVEIAMSRWFWQKDPIAIASAILLFRLPRYFRRLFPRK